MPKPILTDDIVEKAKRDRAQLEDNIRRGMQKDTQLARKYDALEAKQAKNSVYKSRRIENAKRESRIKKLDKWIIVAIIIFILLSAWILSPWS